MGWLPNRARQGGLGRGRIVSTKPPHRAPRMELDGHVDQVNRKEQFLADHPDVIISAHPEAPPWAFWQGQVPDCPQVSSGELGHLLDKLGDQVAARDAHARWPNWTFTRTFAGWQAKQTDGPELFVARTLEQVEARVAQHERINGPSHQDD
jgi:hypothetical protein